MSGLLCAAFSSLCSICQHFLHVATETTPCYANALMVEKPGRAENDLSAFRWITSLHLFLITVGSGDAFSAGLLYMLGRRASLDDACDFANRMGALISAKKSSLPEYDISELDRILQTVKPAF